MKKEDRMTNEKVSEFKNYLREVISGNSPDVLGTRAVLNDTSSKKIDAITKAVKMLPEEEIIIFFDDTLTGSGKGGLILSSWGIRYKDTATLAKWDISWEELVEKYTFHTEGMINKKLKLRNGKGNLFTVEKEIALTMTSFNVEWLQRIISNGCRIFTGKEPGTGSEKIVSPQAVEPQNVVAPEVKPGNDALNKPDEAPAFPGAAETEEPPKTRSGESNNKAASAFFVENRGAVILAISLVLVTDFGLFAGWFDSDTEILTMGIKIGFFFLNFISLPLSFIGCVIGNKIRLAIHPDFVIATGFMGLLKEKLFWRFGPQFIGALVGWGLGFIIVTKILGLGE
jgi:hypothetical protein